MKRSEFKKGYTHIYFGNGKGKTSAALGLGLRAAGCGLSVCMLQFLKKSKPGTGELKSVRNIRNFKIIQFNQKHPMFEKNPAKLSRWKNNTVDSLRRASVLLKSGEYDIVILDEILNTINCGFICERTLLDLLRQKPNDVELILTGRSAKKNLIKHADYVSKIESVKHPYNKGVLARKGIEF